MKIGLDAAVLFHPGGYHGHAEALIATFSMGGYPGSAGLARCGMTLAGPPSDGEAGGRYPDMLHWLRP